VDIRGIEAFFALAEELHFGRAAERLGVSPGRVSQLISALEQRLDRQLVLRSSRTVELSAAGELFLAEARAGYRQLEEAIAATRAEARRAAGVLRLGTSALLDPAAGAELAEAFEHRHPGRRAQCIVVRPADLFGPLTRGDVDLLMVPVPGPPEAIPPLPGIEFGPVLARHEYMLFVGGDHTLAGRTVVTAADLAGHALARLSDHLPDRPAEDLPGALSGTRGADLAPPTAEPHDAFDLVVRRGLAFLSGTGLLDLFQGADVLRIPVAGLPPMHTVLACRTGPRDPLTSAFLAMAAEFPAPSLHPPGR
jgi:DNA-binding transcriptional LysR family regulator